MSPDQLGHRLHAQLSHGIGAMHLNGHFADPKIGGDLLVQSAGGDADHHITLALAERFEALPQRRVRLLLGAPRTVLFQGGGNRVEEVLVTKGLGEEVDGAGFHGAHRHGNISVTGEENDRYANLGVGQLFLAFETTHSGQTDIEHEAACRVRVLAFEEAFSRAEKLNLQPDRLEKLL